VLELIKSDKSIAAKMFECLEMREYEKIVHMTGKDIHEHPKIIEYAMKKHYRDLRRRNKEWYVIEDKISFSQRFVSWFADDIRRKWSKEEVEESEGSDQEEGLSTFGISN
jgi:hypothetical protein